MGTEEQWRSVVGYEGLYEVSDLGRVRGLNRLAPNGRRLKARIRRCAKSDGYPQVDLWRDANQCSRKVHQLVLEAFVGLCPVGMEACHNDGDRANCTLDNLRWDTPQANKVDRDRHGRTANGERHAFAKMTDGAIGRIFDLRKSGCTQQCIADWIGLERSGIGRILRGDTWGHLGIAAGG